MLNVGILVTRVVLDRLPGGVVRRATGFDSVHTTGIRLVNEALRGGADGVFRSLRPDVRFAVWSVRAQVQGYCVNASAGTPRGAHLLRTWTRIEAPTFGSTTSPSWYFDVDTELRSPVIDRVHAVHTVITEALRGRA